MRNWMRRSERKWKWSYLVMSDSLQPMDCGLPGSPVHGIFQARILEWVAISFSRRPSWPRDWTRVSHIVGRHVTIWATREALTNWNIGLNWKYHFVMLVNEYKHHSWDFFGGPVVKNLPCNAGEAGLIPGWGTKISYDMEKLSLCAAPRESVCHNEKAK